MKSILDKDFEYIPAVSTNIMERFIANGLQPRKAPLSELDRLRRFRREIEAHANFANHKVIFSDHVLEELLADCDGAEVEANDH